jgi:hypothetical protein
VFARVLVLTRDEQSVAAYPRRSGGDTIDGLGEPVIQRQDRVHAPSNQHGVREPSTVAEETLATAHGQLIGSAQRKDLPDIETGEHIISFDSKAGMPGARKPATPPLLSRSPAFVRVFARLAAF